MTNYVNYIVVFAILTLNGCNTSGIKLTPIMECTQLTNTQICTVPKGYVLKDPCYRTGEQEYECPLWNTRGFQCTSPGEYAKGKKEIEDLLVELASLRRSCK